MRWNIAPVPGQTATIFWLPIAASSTMSLASRSSTPHAAETSSFRGAEVHILEGVVIADDHGDQWPGGVCALASTPRIPTERHPAASVSASLLRNLALIMIMIALRSRFTPGGVIRPSDLGRAEFLAGVRELYDLQLRSLDRW